MRPFFHTGVPPLLILLIVCLGFSVTGAATPLELANGVSLKDLAHHVEILEDPDGVLDADRVKSLGPEAWSHTDERVLQLGYSTSVWWVRLEIHNEGETMASRILEAAWPLLNYLDLHIYENDREITTVLTGDQRPFAFRPLSTRTYAIPLQIPPGAKQTLLLRLAMQSGIFYAVPLRLWLTPDFYERQQTENLMQGAYSGAILALLLYNVLLFFSTRDHYLLLYSFYLGGFAFWYIGFRGYGLQYLWQDAGWFNLQFNLLIPAYLHGLSTLFVIRYLETRERAILLHKLIKIATTLILAVMPATLANQFNPDFPIALPAYFYTTMSNLLILLYVVAGAWLVIRGFRPARYFLLAWSCLILGIIVYRLGEFPGIHLIDHPLIENSINLGSALEFLLLAFALGDRFNHLRNEKLAVEQDAHRLQVRYSMDLAAQVELRTEQLKKTMRQLHQALNVERKVQEEQKQFLATVSHELRTPLAVIDIVTQNLEIDEETTSPAERRGRYDKILQATHRLSALLDDYLDENRFSLLRRGSEPRMTDLKQLLEDAATSARILADGHQLRVEISNVPAGFVCDPDLTRLALRNLADNAVKYTPPGSVVVLRGERRGNGVALSVEDEGTPLPHDVLEQLFLPGRRGQQAGQKPGRGMGLPLARRMIESQGGTLTATSIPGKGNLFCIWLPQ